MYRKRTWSEKQLKDAVKKSYSYRNTIKMLGLRPTGGNYNQVKKYIKEYNFLQFISLVCFGIRTEKLAQDH